MKPALRRNGLPIANSAMANFALIENQTERSLTLGGVLAKMLAEMWAVVTVVVRGRDAEALGFRRVRRQATTQGEGGEG